MNLIMYPKASYMKNVFLKIVLVIFSEMHYVTYYFVCDVFFFIICHVFLIPCGLQFLEQKNF
jgi:hypothetical protein